MRSMIVFRINSEYSSNKGKEPLQLILDILKEYLPQDIIETKKTNGLAFTSNDWDIEISQSAPINDPSNCAITVIVGKIPPGNLLMHRLMLLNKETKSNVIDEYRGLYPQT